MQPIATYTEHRWFNRQSFELWPDRVVIQGRKPFVARWETSYWLRDLNATPTRGWLRSPAFGLGLFVGGMGLGLAAYWLASLGFQHGEHAPIVLGLVGVGGLVVAAWNVRRRPFVAFSGPAGTPLFAVRGPGRTPGSYESFVQALLTQIQLAKGGG